MISLRNKAVIFCSKKFSLCHAKCMISTTPAVYLQQIDYKLTFESSVHDKKVFWENLANGISWFQKWNTLLSDENKPDAKWFSGGKLNTSYNCLDVHVQNGHGSDLAVIYDSPVTNVIDRLTYDELLRKVSNFAGVLAHRCNVKPGDRVVIYMPMVVECLVAMLACSRIGAIHAVVFGGFSAEQLSSRITSAKPRVIVTASYGVEKGKLIDYKKTVDTALEHSSEGTGVEHCIMFNRPTLPHVDLGAGKDRHRWLDWDDAMSKARPHDAIPVDANHPLYILYTSGTTVKSYDQGFLLTTPLTYLGAPKGIVRTNGGHAVALKFAMSSVYGMRPGDCWWAGSEFGWVVGHSFCCYGPLLQRNTTVIYEGKPVGTPDAAQVFRVLSTHKVAGWYTTPSALRSIRHEDPTLAQSKAYRGQLDSLSKVFVVGEHCDAETLHWIYNGLPDRVRLSDTWWQTETGWPITSACMGLGQGHLDQQGIVTPAGSTGLPVPGYDLKVESTEQVDEEGAASYGCREKLGRLVIKLPLPPGTVSTFWNDHERFLKFYFQSYPGYYDTMDVGYVDEKGFAYVLSRADDVINVSGHRLSTSAIEEACYMDKDVIECAVIAVPHKVKGHTPLGLLVVHADCKRSEEQIAKTAVEAVRRLIGPVASFQSVSVVPGLPKTRSGKIARPSLANMAAGLQIKIPPTIEDPSVYGAIYEAFKSHGLMPTNPKDESELIR